MFPGRESIEAIATVPVATPTDAILLLSGVEPFVALVFGQTWNVGDPQSLIT
jgi:hypothetical protein